MKNEKDKEIVLSLEKAVAILNEMCDLDEETTIAYLSEKLGFYKTTVYRIMNTLEANQYVEKNEATRKYKLGSKLFLLGSRVLQQLKIRQLARPELEKIRSQTGECVHLNTRSGDQKICVEVIPAIHVIQSIVHLGHTCPIYAGATAKTLLAFDSDENIKQYLNSLAFETLPANRPITAETLWEDLMKIRQNGYGVSKGEWIQHSVSVSAPIFDHTGKVLASMSISFPSFRYDEMKLQEYVALLKEGTGNVSAKMGYKGS